MSNGPLKFENSQAHSKQEETTNKKENDSSTLIKVDIVNNVSEEWKVEEDKLLASMAVSI